MKLNTWGFFTRDIVEGWLGLVGDWASRRTGTVRRREVSGRESAALIFGTPASLIRRMCRLPVHLTCDARRDWVPVIFSAIYIIA